MRKLCGAILMLAAVSAMVILAAPASYAADDKVKILYEKNNDIIADVPSEILKGTDLVIRAYSQKYDLDRSGIMLYTFNSEGVPDHTTSGRPPSSSVFGKDGYFTFIFSNVTEDVEVSFTALAGSERQQVVPGGDGGPASEVWLAGAVSLVLIIMGTVMLIILVMVARLLAPPPENMEGTA